MPSSLPNTDPTVIVFENGVQLDYSFADCMKYHGTGFPGGVAHGFTVLRRALAELASRIPGGQLERRGISVRTSFPGPGGRDAFELVTRAASDGRYEIVPELARPERGNTLARYVFEVSAAGHTVTCVVRDAGIVADEFIALGAKEEKTEADLARIEVLKVEMRDRILSRGPSEVYDLEG